jgi:hypothetical protein
VAGVVVGGLRGSLGTAWPVVRQHLSVRTAARLTLGHTLPRAAEAAAVTLDGAPLAGMCPRTHRGEEVLVDVGATSGAHALAVRVR